MSEKQMSPYPVRLPAEMREVLKKSADEAGRTLHSEIIQRLKKSLAQEAAA